MKNVLVLGAGLVARPLLRHLLTFSDVRLVIATLDVERARRLAGDHPRVTVLEGDATVPDVITPLLADVHVVVSLLPAPLNPALARACIEHRTHLVNTSYVAPEMAALHERAVAADVLLLNEIGLDPGIDHMSAVAIVRQVAAIGGTVNRFSSCCGGFPAPDANTNPWGYKFSWSPRAVMLAGRQPARFLRGGEVVEVAGAELFDHSWPYEIEGQGVFEIYPNRDSLRYRPLYGLDGAEAVFRGTCRYPGWCATMGAAARLGLFDVEERDWTEGATYAGMLTRLVPPSAAPLPVRLAEHLGLDPDSEVIARLEWAGLLSERPLPRRHAAPLDLFGERLMKLMMYQPGERDMVALRHLFKVGYPDGSREEIRSTLVALGEPWGDSAMARTVSLPAAIAARMILDGGIQARGVQIPVLREIYEPVLAELAERGIALRETRIASFPSPLDPTSGA